MRRLVSAALIVALVGGAYLAVGGYAWASTSAVNTSCMDLHGDQTPATFTATWGSKDKGDLITVDATPYRFQGAVDVSFPSRTPGITLDAWWAAPTDPAAGAVIVVHGRNSCRHDPAVLLPAGMVRKAGFGVLMVDLRDHGTSGKADGHYALGADEWLDVLGAWQWLRDRGYPAKSIGLLGLSMGAASSAFALANETTVAAAWLDSSYADLLSVGVATASPLEKPFVPGALLMGQLIFSVDLLGASPERALAEHLAGRPVAIVQGDADPTVPLEQSKRLVDAAASGGTKAEYWVVVGAKHVASAFVQTPEYARRVAAFFRSHLAPRA